MVEHNAVDDKLIVVFGDEPRPAYDRVHLTDSLSGASSTKLLLATDEWYAQNGTELALRRCRCRNRSRQRHRSFRNRAARSPTRVSFLQPGHNRLSRKSSHCAWGRTASGCVRVSNRRRCLRHRRSRRRTTRHAIHASRSHRRRDFRGLEAAKAIYDLGLNVHLIEAATRLMPRQLDADGAAVLQEKIERLDVKVHCGRKLKEVEALPFDASGSKKLTGLRLTFDTGDPLMVGMLAFTAGVRPRGALAAAVGLSTSDDGGIVVDERLQVIDKVTGAGGTATNCTPLAIALRHEARRDSD